MVNRSQTGIGFPDGPQVWRFLEMAVLGEQPPRIRLGDVHRVAEELCGHITRALRQDG